MEVSRGAWRAPVQGVTEWIRRATKHNKAALRNLSCFICIWVALTEKNQATLILNKPHAGETDKMLWNESEGGSAQPILVKSIYSKKPFRSVLPLSSLPRWHRGGPGALTPPCSLWFLSALAMVVSFIQTRCQRTIRSRELKDRLDIGGTSCLSVTTSKGDSVSQWYREKSTHRPFEGGGNPGHLNAQKYISASWKAKGWLGLPQFRVQVALKGGLREGMTPGNYWHLQFCASKNRINRF